MSFDLCVKIVVVDSFTLGVYVEELVMPGIDGGFTILRNHASLLSVLGKGLVRLRSGNACVLVPITGGVVEVEKNHVILLLDTMPNSILEELTHIREHFKLAPLNIFDA